MNQNWIRYTAKCYRWKYDCLSLILRPVKKIGINWLKHCRQLSVSQVNLSKFGYYGNMSTTMHNVWTYWQFWMCYDDPFICLCICSSICLSVCVSVHPSVCLHRDGTYYWGGEKFSLVQLQPSFGLLICELLSHVMDTLKLTWQHK